MDKIRQWYYLVSGLIASVTAILVAAKLISQGQAASVTGLIEVLGTLLGGGAASTAGVILGRQRKDGVLEKLPPGEMIAQGAQEWQELRDNLQAQAETATTAIADVFRTSTESIPVLGPLTQQLIDSTKLG